MTGRVHSIQTLGGVDGPGVRCVVFLQGCPLRCLYCHNPDTWPVGGGQPMNSDEVVRAVQRVRPYFGRHGGVTLSGGEPLLQADFASEILTDCRRCGIHTAVDTAGFALTPAVRTALEHTDLVLLDIKHTDPRRHRELTGGDLGTVLAFLQHLAEHNTPLWVRQVIVPGWNDTAADVSALAAMLRGKPNVQKVQLLAYRKLGSWKYQQLGLNDRLEGTPELPPDRLAALTAMLEQKLKALGSDRT